MASERSLTPAADGADLLALVDLALEEARTLGATQAEAAVSVDVGLSVSARLGEVETVEYQRDRGMGVTVYFGTRKGTASTADLSPAALRETVGKACSIARFTAEDPCAGLLIVGAAVAAFVWAARSGQFDDLETPAMRVVVEDGDRPPQPSAAQDPPA
jgi:cbb3-type cytochrome oxidase maturation protein